MNNKLISEPEFETSEDKKYEMKAIQDKEVYVGTYQKELLGLYYLVF